MKLVSSTEQIELKRKMVLMRFLAVMGNIIMVSFALPAAWQGNWYNFWILVTVISIVTTLVGIAQLLHHTRGTSTALASVLCIFALYLTLDGGTDGTGAYFSFTLIPMMIVIAGLRIGQLLGGLYSTLLIIALMTDSPSIHAYSEQALPRLIAATVFIVLLSLLIEWTHVQAYLAIKHTAETHQRNSPTDPLTGMMNRLGLERQILKWARPDQPASVALIDIDHFKAINDRYGHDVGDNVLSTFARVIRSNLKESDNVCRWGGEEFVLVFTDVPETEARRIVDELRELIAARTFNFDNHSIRVQFSAGIAALSGESGFKNALKQADNRVYQAKDNGRNQVISSADIT